MLTAMQLLAVVAIIIGAVVGTILAVLAVLAMRQGWREGSTVELLGSDGMPLARPMEDRERPPGDFAE
jgi:hypothetical protein